jgi:glycine/D-amino acid oxidase-like deaminating enzyme/nitrite reductase/ring-hydroxylating ferredoxin subunit
VQRPHRRSYWVQSSPGTDFPQLQSDIRVDVAVIGGGIVGITAARLLKDQGVSVAVIEARRVGEQATGKSTAKITSQHSIIYQTLENKFGSDRAALYAEANEAAIRHIEGLAAEYGIQCDLEAKAAYAYTRDAHSVPKLEKEVEVAQRLGLPASLIREIDLPFAIEAAVKFDHQAQFHPVKYLTGLARTIPGESSHVFERSRAIDWEPGRVVTSQGTVTARHVIMATHLPLGQVGGFYAEAYPHAQPVIAAKIGRVPDGMYIETERPSHSIRTHRNNGEVYGIVTGPSFKPGHVDEERKQFEEIEGWLKQNFEPGPIEYRWVNEDYTPMDSAPFVGWSSAIKDGYLVATGFDAWGISNGTAAAMMLVDLATGKENRWLALFDASRIAPVAGARRFFKENADVAQHLVTGYLSHRSHSPSEIAPGEAAVLKIDGEYVGAFRDEDGQLHSVSAVCTHMGCMLGWNENDRTWDCHCHGSRFEFGGEVIHGPATKPLERKIV